MKKLLTIIFFLFSAHNLLAQEDIPDWSPWKVSDSGVYSYQSIVDVSGVPAGKLFDRMEVWSAQNFKNSNFSIQLSDKEKGIIIAKTSISYYVPAGLTSCDCTMFFTLTSEFKDGRARVTFDDIFIADGSVKHSPSYFKKGFNMYKKYADSVKANSLDVSIKLMENIEKSLLQEEEDW